MKEPIFSASWLKAPFDAGRKCISFEKKFDICKKIKKATLFSTAIGVYRAELNGKKVGCDVMTPGWTSYRFRLLYQSYDITDMLSDKNTLCLMASVGWRMKKIKSQATPFLDIEEPAVIAAVLIEYDDGVTDTVLTDETWTVSETKLRFCDIYNGETYDCNFIPPQSVPAYGFMHPKNILIKQTSVPIREQERLPAKELIITPSGETVIDFGQNMTGYVEFTVQGKKGDTAVIHHAEVLSADGNFYTENYRTAKNEITFVCDGEKHTYKPMLTFQGFRYIKLVSWPDEINPSDFTAIVVHTELERTGSFECSDSEINQLYHNIIWGQKSNFLDIPTDCPQRDERLGWTGDAQVFCRCASLNFNVSDFFYKWLSDMAVDQRPTGSVPVIIPNLDWCSPSAGWSDAAVICPWQMYLSYGDEKFLYDFFPMMRRWVDYTYDNAEYVKGENHFGDWLAMDVSGTERVGLTDKKYIACAFRIYITKILIKAAKITKLADTDIYEKRLSEALREIREMYFTKDGIPVQKTQTARVLAVKFGLYEEKNREITASLASMIHENGDRLTTGFLGTPYLLSVLSENGERELAYTLLFQKKCPSWLYSVEHGATTMWEHWDSRKEDGSFWSPSMNSFNHYAYGAVGDWLYSVAAGINYTEDAPGFEKTVFEPLTDSRLSYVRASLMTKYGCIKSEWERKDGKTEYIFTVPPKIKAEAVLGGTRYALEEGENRFTI